MSDKSKPWVPDSATLEAIIACIKGTLNSYEPGDKIDTERWICTSRVFISNKSGELVVDAHPAKVDEHNGHYLIDPHRKLALNLQAAGLGGIVAELSAKGGRTMSNEMNWNPSAELYVNIVNRTREKIEEFSPGQYIDEWDFVTGLPFKGIVGADVHYTNQDGPFEVICYPVMEGESRTSLPKTDTHRWFKLDYRANVPGVVHKDLSAPNQKKEEKPAEDKQREPDLSYLKVGDRVWDTYHWEWSEVTKATPFGHLVFGERTKITSSVCINGRVNGSFAPVRFYPNRWNVPEEAFVRPLPELAVDTPIWVYEDGGKSWYPRHFAYWDRDGKPVVFTEGKTSHSAPGMTVRFHKWSLTDPDKGEGGGDDK
jgi:hypothetical protein